MLNTLSVNDSRDVICDNWLLSTGNIIISDDIMILKGVILVWYSAGESLRGISPPNINVPILKDCLSSNQNQNILEVINHDILVHIYGLPLPGYCHFLENVTYQMPEASIALN